jgi:hypothetical protein
MCSADGFVNAHRWVASAALAPRPAVDLTTRLGGKLATSFTDARSVNERVSVFERGSTFVLS